MINFRYHVVSLAAALLALAVGIVLGAGLLDQDSSSTAAASGSSSDPALSSFESGYVGRTSPTLLKDTLKGQSVVVLTTSTARAADVKGVSANIEAAGGEVVGELELTSKLLDPGGRQFAEGVAQQVGEDVPGIATDGEGYARIGAALARSLVADKTADVDDAATTLRTAFTEADLLAAKTQPKSRASLAVVVNGPRSSTSQDQGVALAGLASALDVASGGVVVAGPTSSSTSGGALDAVRSAEDAGSVSTVDVVDSAAGRVVVAIALAAEVSGTSGSWGTSRSADGAVPSA